MYTSAADTTPPDAERTLCPIPVDTQIVGRRILVFAEVDSTNNRALAASGDGVVIVAERQTAGRGRHGRRWHSAPGLGLWFSVGLEGAAPGLMFAAALAVRDALANVAALRVKWPNDLLLNGKKVCGILVEHRDQRTALGIGLNVLHGPDDLPRDLRTPATSLALETRLPLERSNLLKAILEQLDRRLVALRRGHLPEIRQEWTHACGLIGSRVRAGFIEGYVRGINEAGALYVVAESGGAHWITDDVTVLGHQD